ncbi:hypothetical protein LXL04_003987 [Taraxacum kok-saghyz]
MPLKFKHTLHKQITHKTHTAHTANTQKNSNTVKKSRFGVRTHKRTKNEKIILKSLKKKVWSNQEQKCPLCNRLSGSYDIVELKSCCRFSFLLTVEGSFGITRFGKFLAILGLCSGPWSFCQGCIGGVFGKKLPCGAVRDLAVYYVTGPVVNLLCGDRDNMVASSSWTDDQHFEYALKKAGLL